MPTYDTNKLTRADKLARSLQDKLEKKCATKDELKDTSALIRSQFEAKISDAIKSEAAERKAADAAIRGEMGSLASAIRSEHLPLHPEPDPAEGWMVNWLFENGWYLGGIKKDCGSHPPVVGENHTSWVVLVLNGMNTGENGNINRNHRVQIAWDLVNSKCYMRRGWMSANTWADSWQELGGLGGQTVATDKERDAMLKEVFN